MLMPDNSLHDEPAVAQGPTPLAPSEEPVIDTLQAFTLAPPAASRFLFVNVAALRTKQLRRGAMLRLETSDRERVTSAKPERLAMEEIRRGLVSYHLPQ